MMVSGTEWIRWYFDTIQRFSFACPTVNCLCNSLLASSWLGCSISRLSTPGPRSITIFAFWGCWSPGEVKHMCTPAATHRLYCTAHATVTSFALSASASATPGLAIASSALGNRQRTRNTSKVGLRSSGQPWSGTTLEKLHPAEVNLAGCF